MLANAVVRPRRTSAEPSAVLIGPAQCVEGRWRVSPDAEVGIESTGGGQRTRHDMKAAEGVQGAPVRTLAILDERLEVLTRADSAQHRRVDPGRRGGRQNLLQCHCEKRRGVAVAGFLERREGGDCVDVPRRSCEGCFDVYGCVWPA
jgi:hypothetical protein